MSPVRRLFLLLSVSLLLGPAPAAEKAAERALLPPELPWEGRSLELVAADDDPWVTPSELTGLTRTPSYDETVAWLRRLAEAAPEIDLVSLGKSHQGRDIWMVVASGDRTFTPAAMRASGKPILLAHAGIHSGEIDGKDAGLMLLRDLTVGGSKREILEAVHFLFIPILNVDGHERSSAYGRINQRGPVESGWRTNARNQNLNRDFAKLDTPEVRALVVALNMARPDLYVDLHVTDGIDYQYDITWGYGGSHGWSPHGARWLDEVLRPVVDTDLSEMGHIPGPLIFARDDKDPRKGIVQWTAPPRFSTGYGDARHLPTVLVENHSLKPYRQRVLGTYVFLESALRTLGREGAALREAVVRDEARRPDPLPLEWTFPQEQPATTEFLGVGWRTEQSSVSGAMRMIWTGEPVTLDVPWIPFTRVTAEASRPAAYWVPVTQQEVIERLAIHGIHMEVIEEPREIEVEMYRIEDATLDKEAYEGHVRVNGTPKLERRTERFPAGSVRVPTDQPLGDLAMLLLEPAAPDSFFRWGFFLEMLQRTEYVEGYVMEPMAERMLAEDEGLRAEFEAKLEADPEFAADPGERLQWFYRKTPFFDERWRLYPVGREPAAAGASTTTAARPPTRRAAPSPAATPR